MSVPITQHIHEKKLEELKKGLVKNDRIAIRCPAISNSILAVMENPTFYPNRKEEIVARTFGMMSRSHPKAERIFGQGDYLVTCESMRFLKDVIFNDGMDQFRLTPS